MILAVLILFIPVFFYPIHDAFGIAKLAYLAVLTAIAAYRLWRMKEVKIPYAVPLLLYLLAVALSAKNVIYWYQYILAVGMDLTGITVMIYMANAKIVPKHLMIAVARIALVFSAFAIFLYVGPTIYPGKPDWAWESTMGNTGFAAGMLAALIPIVVWLAWTDGKVWLWLTLALQTVHLDMTIARTPWVSLVAVSFVALIAAAIKYPAKRWRLVSAGLGLGIVIILLSAAFMDIQSQKPQSIGVRLIYWAGTWEIIKEHPVFGAGRGQMQVVALPYMAKAGDSGLFFVDHIHNDYFEIWAETGPLGLAALLAMIGMALYKSLEPPKWRWVVGLAYLTLLINALTFFPLHTVAQATYFWAYAGLIARQA